jgi:type IV pilus assembly protein PilM
MFDWKQQIALPPALQPRRRRAGARNAAPARRETKARELVGLDIGSSHLAAAHIVNNGSKELVQLVREPLAPGIVSGGEVRDPAALGAALDRFFVEHELPRRGVRLGLGNTRVGVRLIEIAGVEDDEHLRNAISFRAHELLSVPIEDAAIDYHVIGEDVDADGQRTRRIVLVVAYRDSVDRFLAATDQAGIQIAGIDLEAFALLRAVAEAPPAEGSEAAAVALCLGHERTTLAISDGHVCRFTRVLDWGGSSLTAALARALKISGEEAERLKQDLSLEPEASPPEGLPAARNEEALEAIRHELQTLVRELLSSLRFYQSQPGSLPIGDVSICGGTAELGGLGAELERELGLPVRMADPLAGLIAAEAVEPPAASGALAVAIGLGIEDK